MSFRKSLGAAAAVASLRLLVPLTVAAADRIDTPPRVVEEIVAKVNSEIITRGELEQQRAAIRPNWSKQGLTGPALEDAVKKRAADASARPDRSVAAGAEGQRAEHQRGCRRKSPGGRSAEAEQGSPIRTNFTNGCASKPARLRRLEAADEESAVDAARDRRRGLSKCDHPQGRAREILRRAQIGVHPAGDGVAA